MGRLNFFKVRAARIVGARPTRRVKQNSTQRKRRLLFEALHERMVLATVTWDGGAGTSSWNDADNWDGNQLPGASDDVVIGDLSGTPTITINATTSVQSVTAAEKVALASGVTFTTSQLSTYNAGVGLAGGTFSPNSGADVYGASTWTAGNIVGNGSGTISLYGSMAFSGISNRSAQNIAIINHGTFTQTAGQLDLSNATFDNHATYQLQGASSQVAIRTFGTGLFANVASGTAVFEDTMTGVHGVSGLFENAFSATMTVASGTFQFPGGRTHAGAFDVSSGATLQFQGSSGFNSGTAFPGAGTVHLLSGTYSVGGDLTIPALVNSATITVASGRTLSLSSPTLSGGTLTGAGTVALSGTTVVAATTTVSGNVVNSGTFEIGGVNRQVLLNSPGVLTNASAATIAITTTANPAIAGTGQIDNSGLITSSGTTGISVNNSNNLSGGEIQVLSGTLSLPASGSHAGTFTADAGATMNIQNGTMTLNGGTSFGGGGTINLFGGTYNVTDDISGTNLNLSFAANFMNISDGKTFTLTGNNTLAGANFSNVVTATGTLRNTGTLAVTGAVGVNRGTFRNAGTLSASTASATVTVGTGASIINESTGTYQLLSTSGIQGATGSFVNHGTLNRAGSGTAPINAPTTGSGAITVSSGVLDFQRGGTFANDITTAAGATTKFGNSFAYTFNTGSSFLDTGTVEFANGTFNFTDDVTASSNVAMSSSFGTVNVSAGKTFAWAGSANSIAGGALAGSGSIVNSGLLTISGTSLSNALTLSNATSGVVAVTGNLTLSGAGSIVNQGTWRRTTSSGTATVANAFSNLGSVEVQSGTLTLSGVVSQATTATLTGGTWISDAGTLDLSNSPALTVIGAAAVVRTNGNRFPKLASLATNQGSFEVTSGGSFATVASLDNQGTITVPNAATLTVHSSGSLTNTGTLALEGGSVIASAINHSVGGFIEGSGVIQGTVVSDGGTIGNADGPGALSIVGAYQQASRSDLRIELGGAVAGISYDQLNISGTVTLAGELHVSVVENYLGNQAFTIIDNDGNDPVSGTFDGLPEGATITLGASVLQLSYVGGDGNDVVLTA
ncbi:MAG: beta strand repeat-containing protein, partial [Planctomycetaceae bacterium]